MIEMAIPKPEIGRKGNDHQPKKTGAETAVAPITLMGYYADKKVNAHRFVDALHKARVQSFAPADTQAALDQLRNMDPSLERTSALLVASRKTPNRQVPELLTAWVRSVVVSLAVETGAASSLPDDVVSTHPESLLHTFVQSLQSKLNGGPAERSRAVGILRLVLGFVGTRGPADPIGVARVVCRGLDVRKSQKATTSQALRDRALGLLVNANVRILDQAITLADLGEVMLKEATENASRSQTDAADQRRQVQKLSSALDAAREEISALKARLALSEEFARQSERNAQDHKLIRTNTDQQTRGRMVGFIRDNLLPTLEQAFDAADLKPPRPEILQSLLRRIQDDGKKQVTWLTAPSE